MNPIAPSKEMLSKFHVITMISNPVRFHTRYELYRDFAKHMQDSGANLWTVEVAFGNRPFEITKAEAPQDIRFRTLDEIWHKENALNLALARLPEDWEYVAWIDADLLFHNPRWVQETVQQLQHHEIVQLFAYALDLGPNMEPMQMHRGFVKGYWDEGFKCPNIKKPQLGSPDYYGGFGGKTGSFAHPGYAWAATRKALTDLGGLIDFAVLGSGDHHMAMALIGEVERTFPSQIASRYAQKMLRWQERAEMFVKRDIGYVKGTISHYFHGKKKDRKYRERWEILVGNKFDPDKDLKRDTQGLYVWTDNNIRIRDEVRAYFRQRNEDSIDL